jgi:carbamoyltransferase
VGGCGTRLGRKTFSLLLTTQGANERRSTLTAILGISAFYHDSAAALVINGDIVAAAQEERFTRNKHDCGFPKQAIAYCLEEGGLAPEQLDYVAFYEKPIAKFERLLDTYLAYVPSGLRRFRMAMPIWLKEKLHIPRTIRRELGSLGRTRLVFLDHHESHAASAFFPSPFQQAAILTLDGVGEWSTTTLGTGVGNKIELTQHLRFPHSLGLLYAAFTYYCGFKVNSDEYKLMGLAPYGKPIYQAEILKHLIDLKPNGSFRLGMPYFDYCHGLTMTNRRFHDLFGGPPRTPGSALRQRHMDLAASVQAVTEEVLLRMARTLHQQTGMKNVVLAGGVALNCVANGRLLRQGPFEAIWIQPAAGDAGGALGAALFVWHQLLENPRIVDGQDRQKGSYLGPRFSTDAIRRLLEEKGARYRHFRKEADLLEHTAQTLTEEKVVGWFQGRMEFGPRALGGRSILGDARSPKMQSTMNLKIKFRESFRPFAPCVLREHVHEWFAMRPGEDSPYMLLVAPVLEKHRQPLSKQDQENRDCDPDLVRRVNRVRSSVPAITHVDYSARVQTVDERHGRFHRLLKRFHEKTGCPILVNTSFNLSWEPIVATPEEAYHTFMQSEMDVLVLEDFVLHKAEQPVGLQPWAPANNGSIPHPTSPWADPLTGEPLIMTASSAHNPVTGVCYPVEEGLPRLLVPTTVSTANGQDVLDTVKQFYEKTPFPNYDHLDDRRVFFEKAGARLFARLLNEQIPYGARVLEVGCGTGQLTNFLAMAHRSVLGVDVCLNSLRLAHKFKSEQGLDGATFAQMNLFRPGLRDGFFDYVISNGVLHSTSDCRAAFLRISRLAKPGGYVIVGLYNAYSRQLHYARVLLYRWTGITSRWLDPHFGRVSADGKREAWFQDQYCHPRETCHTLDELLGWMDEAGLDFVNSIPKPRGGPVLTPDEDLFALRDAGTAFSRVLSQLADMGSGYREGGFFIVCGRRRGKEGTYTRSSVAESLPLQGTTT